MAAEFTGEEIIEITGGRLAAGLMPDEAGPICTDTRRLMEGSWFLALPGKEYDGHDFLGDAFSADAVGCIVDERGAYAVTNPQFPLVAVENTLDAYHQLARNWRRRLNPRVVAVCATQHELSRVVKLCTRVLSPEFRLHAENPTFTAGTVLSVLEAVATLPDDAQLLIVQVAPHELGQTEALARALVPTIVVITESSFEHLRAANEDHRARAECDLLAHLEKHRGLGLIARRSPDLSLRIRNHFSDRTLIYGASSEHEARITGDLVSAADLWCVAEACRRLGVSETNINVRLSSVLC